jgi:hypothetical protein
LLQAVLRLAFITSATGFGMKTIDTLEHASARPSYLDSSEAKNMTVEERIEHWKRIGEANAKKYGVKAIVN